MSDHTFYSNTLDDWIRLICSPSGICCNHSSVYKHYQYKEDLLEGLMEDVLADLAVSYREPYRNQAHLEIGKLTASAIKIFEHVERHAKLYTLVIEARALPGFQNRIGDVLRDLILQDLHSYSLPAKMNREL